MASSFNMHELQSMVQWKGHRPILGETDRAQYEFFHCWKISDRQTDRQCLLSQLQTDMTQTPSFSIFERRRRNFCRFSCLLRIFHHWNPKFCPLGGLTVAEILWYSDQRHYGWHMEVFVRMWPYEQLEDLCGLLRCGPPEQPIACSQSPRVSSADRVHPPMSLS